MASWSSQEESGKFRWNQRLNSGRKFTRLSFLPASLLSILMPFVHQTWSSIHVWTFQFPQCITERAFSLSGILSPRFQTPACAVQSLRGFVLQCSVSALQQDLLQRPSVADWSCSLHGAGARLDGSGNWRFSLAPREAGNPRKERSRNCIWGGVSNMPVWGVEGWGSPWGWFFAVFLGAWPMYYFPLETFFLSKYRKKEKDSDQVEQLYF